MPGAFRALLSFLAILALAAGVSQSAEPGRWEEIVVNGGFEEGRLGWQARPTMSEADWDVVAGGADGGGHAAVLPGRSGNTSGIWQEQVTFAEPAVRLEGRYRGKTTAADASSLVGLDLMVVLTDDSVVWWIPPEARLGPAHRDWTERVTVYEPPEGLGIKAVRVLLINYRTGEGASWFDDVSVKAYFGRSEEDAAAADPASVPGAGGFRHDGPRAPVALLEAGEPDLPAAGLAARALEQAGVPYERVSADAPLHLYDVVVVPQFQAAAYWPLKAAYYQGSRLLFLTPPAGTEGEFLIRYIWEAMPGQVRPGPGRMAFSGDGRAALAGDGVGEAEVAEAVQKLLAARLTLPERVPARAYDRPKPKLAIEDGALTLDGKPFFFRGVGAYRLHTSRGQWDEDLRRFAEMGMSGVVAYVWRGMTAEDVEHFLDRADAAGLKVWIWIYDDGFSASAGYLGSPWKDEWVQRFVALRRHPALLGWIIGDDVRAHDAPLLERLASVLRRYDGENLIAATLLDFRRPGQVEPALWARWQQILDFPITYVYPLLRDRGVVTSEGGLEDVQRLAENVWDVWGEGSLVYQWSQAHMQNGFPERWGLVHGASGELFLPSPEQQRLLTYMMLAAGVKGILYYADPWLRDQALGQGRRSEIGLMWQELGPFEELLAAARPRPVWVDDPQAEAVAYRRGAEQLVILVDHPDDAHWAVTAEPKGPVRLRIPVDGPGEWSVLLAGFPAARKLPWRQVSPAEVEVTVPRWDLTALVYVAADPRRAEEVARWYEERRREAALFAEQALQDTRIKTEVVADWIADAAARPAAVEALLQEARDVGEAAYAGLVEGRWDESFELSRTGLVLYRRVQHALLEQARGIAAARGQREAFSELLRAYFSLPKFYQEIGLGPAVLGGVLGARVRGAWLKETTAKAAAARGAASR